MDSSRIEIIIQQLLQEHDATYVADDLLKKWDRGELSQLDQHIAAQFLIHAGFLETLKNQFGKQLAQDRYIAWVPLLEMVSKSIKAIPDDVIDPILVGMTEENQLEDLIYIQKLKKFHPRFEKLINAFLAETEKTLTEEKKQLTEKLQRQINDRMDTEVRNLSLLLRERFPGDNEVLDITSNLDLAKIRTLIQQKEKELQQYLPQKKENLNSPEKTKIVEDVIKNAEMHPSSAYNLAILLTQMEFFDDALISLSYAPASREKDWLKLDLLIKSENYIDAINESFEIEKKYSQDPETILKSLQLRAQAMYGLGEKEKAIQILEKLLETAPKMQTAKVLLHLWRTI